MNCFNHKMDVAIGHCKFCHRGLCPECYKIVAGSIVCKDGECGKEISDLYEMTLRSKQIYMIGSNKKFILPTIAIVFLLFGILFLGIGMYEYYIEMKSSFVSMIMGGFFFLLGLFTAFRKNKVNV